SITALWQEIKPFEQTSGAIDKFFFSVQHGLSGILSGVEARAQRALKPEHSLSQAACNGSANCSQGGAQERVKKQRPLNILEEKYVQIGHPAVMKIINGAIIQPKNVPIMRPPKDIVANQDANTPESG